MPSDNHAQRTFAAIKQRNGRQRYRPSKIHYFIGIDGEGQGRADHKYVFLAASDEHGRYRWKIENKNGIPTKDALDFLLSLPKQHTKSFAYGFNYDITKILTDLPDAHLFALFRPEMRRRKGGVIEQMKGPKPIYWEGYSINLQASKFTVRHAKTGRRIVIWDILKFYQTKFVDALEKWKVGEFDILANMRKMKEQRSEFDKLNQEQVQSYCLDECHYIAQLARKLTDAHTKIGLKLRAYYGPGTSASEMMNGMGVRKLIRPPPEAMKIPVGSAFFGGRFEHSMIGAVRDTVYGYDISSAYPYQLCFLPCLLHARWEHTKHRADLDNVRNALVRYALPAPPPRFSFQNYNAWGPFPFRTRDGSITFPRQSGGGWVWLDEYIEGEKLFPHTQFLEAWIYKSDCDCVPFPKVPEYYTERLRIGKDGPGIVLKLALNSIYGKLAQSIGLAPFNSWIWAGLITSGTRAQILRLLSLHKNWSNLLMVATDGIYTREELVMPQPRDTGTWDAIDVKDGKKKPLGGWEKKGIKKGVFLCRPGIYFPLGPTTDEIDTIRARGIGKAAIFEHWKMMIEAWENGTHNYEHDCYYQARDVRMTVRVKKVSRFCGAKTTISFSEKDGFKRASGNPLDAEPAYGQWIERPIDLSFHPMPKRRSLNPDGVTLRLRRMKPELTSAPYNPAVVSNEARTLMLAALEMQEQPNADFTDYEEDYNT